jgi:signal transduction histidine kinase
VSVSRRFFSAAAWTIGGSLAAAIAFNGGAALSIRQLATQTFVNVLLSGPCVALCVLALPVFVPFAHRKMRFPIDWIAIVGVLVGFGMIGSFVGGMAGIAIGLVRPQPLVSWYSDVVKVAVYFTVIFGLSATAAHQLRARLASTTVALRTKERDEAEARRLAAEARLASLEARVDPHFLFNTLNSIAALVRENPAAAERIIEQLASLMRSSLDRRASLVTLDDELALVRSYLDIERVRFGDRLRFRIESAPGTGRALVPRMSLQTLAENAVKYAVSASRDGATVTVTAERNNGILRLAVEDDGPGFDAMHVPDGHGLHLLHSRLAMVFGESGGVTTDSHPGRTCVTLTVPFTEMPPTTTDPVRTEPPSDVRCL